MADDSLPMPSAKTLWQTDRTLLSPSSPVTLRWDNGKGLTFVRKISINDDYLITYNDQVESRLDQTVTLFPYGLVRRQDTPQQRALYPS